MTRRPQQFYSLKRPKIRASWNLRNLYNLSRLRRQQTVSGKTFYQQKYEAKQLTRAYHGEQIREGKWTRMFSRYLPSVVEMDARGLAMQDGVEQSSGRGAGRDEFEMGKKTSPTPYMQMTYWMNERRLDTAIFRSLFASSLRQARQMVVHGHVKVNGKRFIHPSYLLNPGDMFSVDPEMVLFATGNTGVAAQQSNSSRGSKAQKKSGNETDADLEAKAIAESAAKAQQLLEEEDDGSDDIDPDWSNLPSLQSASEFNTASAEDQQDLETPARRTTGPPLQLDEATIKARRVTLKELYDLTRETEDTQLPSAKQKIALRTLRKRYRPFIAKPWNMTDDDIDVLAEELEDLITAVESRTRAERAAANSDSGIAELIERPGQRPALRHSDQNAEQKDVRNTNHVDALAKVDGFWEPKDYMAPFAFVPRYLEVNYTVCSAVYLRNPVARMGLAEVPTPFSLETGNLAFSYYLRRR